MSRQVLILLFYLLGSLCFVAGTVLALLKEVAR